MYEAAAIDGAGPLKKFFYITLPSIRVILLLMVLLRAVQTINAPDLIFGDGAGRQEAAILHQLYHDGGGRGNGDLSIRSRRYPLACYPGLYGNLYCLHQCPEGGDE